MEVRFAIAWYMGGNLINNIWTHGALGLNYRSFNDINGYISQLYTKVQILNV